MWIEFIDKNFKHRIEDVDWARLETSGLTVSITYCLAGSKNIYCEKLDNYKQVDINKR